MEAITECSFLLEYKDSIGNNKPYEKDILYLVKEKTPAIYIIMYSIVRENVNHDNLYKIDSTTSILDKYIKHKALGITIGSKNLKEFDTKNISFCGNIKMLNNSINEVIIYTRRNVAHFLNNVIIMAILRGIAVRITLYIVVASGSK